MGPVLRHDGKLLIPSAFCSSECSQSLFADLLQGFDEGSATLVRLRQHPGDPWKRVSAEMDGAAKSLSEGLLTKVFGKRKPRRLTTTEAGELAQLQLQAENLEEEFKAYMYAWEGSINVSPLLRDMAMPKDRANTSG